MRTNFTISIAYQGSKGSYSEELLTSKFTNYHGLPCESFTELITTVNNRQSLGLLPVENSIAGTVNEAYEELIESGLKILGEFIKKIDHSLIGLPDSKLDEITHVISHPQALQQCSKFLQESKLRITPVSDTAGSAFEILETKDINTAAIAGKHFSHDKRFKILKEDISNHMENFTRFLVIGKMIEDKGQTNKTSVMINIQDEPGSLMKILKPFAEFPFSWSAGVE